MSDTSRRNAYHEKLDKILNVFFKDDKEETEEVKLAQSTLEDGTVIEYEALEPGMEVMVIVEGEDPVPAPDGEHMLEDGTKIVVADGVISEVMPVEEEPAAEEEMKEEEEEVKAEEEEEEVKRDPMEMFNPSRFEELVDLSKDGFYTIQFSVANGKIEWGNLFSESFQELKAEHEEQTTKVAELEKQLEEQKQKFEEDLKILGKTIKETTLVQAPIENGEPVKLTRKEFLARVIEEKRKEKLAV